MTKQVLTDASVVIGGVDLSDHVESVELDYSSELQDVTSMGDTTRTRLGGLLDWSMNITFRQDYAASEVDATLFPLVGTTFTITGKPTSAAVSATNPSYSGTGILESYSPLGGSIGDTHAAQVTIQASGPLTRATS